jgi:hypothetical protein
VPDGFLSGSYFYLLQDQNLFKNQLLFEISSFIKQHHNNSTLESYDFIKNPSSLHFNQITHSDFQLLFVKKLVLTAIEQVVSVH